MNAATTDTLRNLPHITAPATLKEAVEQSPALNHGATVLEEWDHAPEQTQEHKTVPAAKSAPKQAAQRAVSPSLPAEAETGEEAPLDSVALAPAPVRKVKVVKSVPEKQMPVEEMPSRLSDSPWLLLGIILLFLLFCAKIRKNLGFLQSLFTELTNVRTRSSLFRSTVRETTFSLILNTMCALSAGILIYTGMSYYGFGLPDSPLLSALLCAAAAGIYCLAMPLVYRVTGNLFTDRRMTELWVRGFVASQSILGLFLLPVALLAMFYPESFWWICPVGAVVIGGIKILFIFKGLRIFLNDFSSLIIFFYYLCGVEIVPLLLTVALAGRLCGAFI